MKLYKCSFSKKEFDRIPEKEQLFFVQMSNLLNDINVLYKLTTFSYKKGEKGVIAFAQNSQAFFILIILAGKLYEGWRLLEKAYFPHLSNSYKDILDSHGIESIENLKKYFSNSKNIIKYIRKKFAFHYDSDEIKKELVETSDPEIFELFFSEFSGNCLYYISNVLIGTAIANKIDKTDTHKALDAVIKEILEASKWYQKFGNNCLSAIAKKYISIKFEEIDIPEPPDINDVFIPFFVKKIY